MAEKSQTDSLMLTKEEALYLMVHHLRLAALMFELVPDGESTEESIEIILRELHRQIPLEDLQRPAMERFVRQIVTSYEMENDD